jgi:hypothetical protein
MLKTLIHLKKITKYRNILAFAISILILIPLHGCTSRLTGIPQNFKLDKEEKLIFGKVSVYVKKYNQEERELLKSDILMCINVTDPVTGQKKERKCGNIYHGSLLSIRPDEVPYYGYVMLSVPTGVGSIDFLRIGGYFHGNSLRYRFPQNMEFDISETSNATYFGNISFHIYEEAPFAPYRGVKNVYFPKVSIAIEDAGDKVVKKLDGLPKMLTRDFKSNIIKVKKSKYTAEYSSK